MWKKFCNYLDPMKFRHKMFFFDTKFPMSHTSSFRHKEMTHGYWEDYLRPAHGLFTRLRVSEMCSTLQRPLQGQTLLLLEPVSLHGFRSIDLSGKSPGHRSLSALCSTETLSHGFPRQRLAQYAGSCQSSQRLANLRRLCPDSHWSSAPPLRQRFLRCRIESNRLCFGLQHHRSLPLAFPLGQVPSSQRRREIAYFAEPPSKHSLPRHYYPRQGSRYQDSRSADLRAGSFLYHRPRLSGFRSPLRHPSSLGLLCDPSQKQLQVQAPVLSGHRQIHRGSIRPDDCPGRILFPQSLPRQASSHSLFRHRPKQTAHLSDQQLHSTSIDPCRTVSLPLADRTVLQMTQTASSNQRILRKNRK